MFADAERNPKSLALAQDGHLQARRRLERRIGRQLFPREQPASRPVNTTMRIAHMVQSGISPRLRCKIRKASPARHLEKRRKTLTSGGPKNGFGSFSSRTLVLIEGAKGLRSRRV